MACKNILCLFLLLVNGHVWAKNIGEACTPPSGGNTDECSVDNSECVTNVCVCTTGFTEEGGKCLKDLGATCGNANECVSNAVCDTTCKCKTGYEHESGLCQKAPVSEVECTDGGDECSDIAHSECDTTMGVLKCKCVAGYKVDATDDSVCVKVIGSQCSGSNACSDVPNSVCVSDKCVCSPDYGEKNNLCILTVSGTVCTDTGVECANINNAICDAEGGKCKCSPGSTMNIDTCVPENGAATTRDKEATLLAISVLVAIKVVFW